MKNKKETYCGIVPAMYACYEDTGAVSLQRTRDLTRHLLQKGVNGLYVGGSSGECIYQTVEERKAVLEAVMAEAKGAVPIYAHVACNGIAQSRALAAHAEQQGVSAIFAIPPLYFRLPESCIAEYWNAISDAAPHTDFFIYNIPQLAGVSLTRGLLREMLKNPRVAGVKNSSMPVQDIQIWLDEGGGDTVVFNGPDEQLLSGLTAGAAGGIGGTYAVMPELYLKIFELFRAREIEQARLLQNEVCRIIETMCSAKGNLYAVMKEILKRKGVELGGVRSPLRQVQPEDSALVLQAETMIAQAIAHYCGKDCV